MNLDQVNKWLTLLANVGVIAGIVLVAIQLKQNTDAIRVQTAYDANNVFVDWDLACMGDNFAEANMTAQLNPSELTIAQSGQVLCGIDAVVSGALNVWIAYREGRASQNEWETSKTALLPYIDYDVGRVIWASYKDLDIDPEFYKEVDATLAQRDIRAARVTRRTIEGIQKIGHDQPVADAELQSDDSGAAENTSAPQ